MVFCANADGPTAVLALPVVLNDSAELPIAVLEKPVVFALKANHAVFPAWKTNETILVCGLCSKRHKKGIRASLFSQVAEFHR